MTIPVKNRESIDGDRNSLGAIMTAYFTKLSLVGRVLRSPFKYLVAYLVAIPCFAFPFYLIPFGLYSPYARYERAAHSDYSKIRDSIEDALKYSYYINSPVSDNPSFIDAGTVHVDKLYIDSEKIEFGLDFDAAQGGLHVSVPPTWRIHSIPDFHYSYQGQVYFGHFLYVPNNKGEWVSYRVPDSSVTWLFGCPGKKTPAPVVCLTNGQQAKIDNFHQGLEGNPNAYSGGYWRAVYFSAMTITSVGYGDIIPLRRITRALAGAEAIIGIILLGLFINASTSRTKVQGAKVGTG